MIIPTPVPAPATTPILFPATHDELLRILATQAVRAPILFPATWEESLRILGTFDFVPVTIDPATH